MTDDNAATFDEWAILELMGHRRLAGKVSEATIGGAALVRLDVPGPGDTWIATQYYSGGAIYCITPVAEDVARKVAARTANPAPVTRWELELGTDVEVEVDSEDEEEVGWE